LGTALGQRLGVHLLLPSSAGVDPCDELIQLSPSSCGGGFLVNGIGRMIGCGGRSRREVLIDRGASRSNGNANWGKKGLGRPDHASRPRWFSAWFDPVFLSADHLSILDLAPFICVILRSSSPRSSYRVSSHEVPVDTIFWKNRSKGIRRSSDEKQSTIG
jgi:hypothetical protein